MDGYQIFSLLMMVMVCLGAILKANRGVQIRKGQKDFLIPGIDSLRETAKNKYIAQLREIEYYRSIIDTGFYLIVFLTLFGSSAFNFSLKKYLGVYLTIIVFYLLALLYFYIKRRYVYKNSC